MEDKDAVYKNLVEKPLPPEKKLPSSKLAAVALIVAMSGPFHFGYQLVITNPSQEVDPPFAILKRTFRLFFNLLIVLISKRRVN